MFVEWEISFYRKFNLSEGSSDTLPTLCCPPYSTSKNRKKSFGDNHVKLFMFDMFIGVCCRIYGGTKSKACSKRQVRCWSINPGGDFCDYVLACVAKRLPLHPEIHHPCRRHDGRQCNDSHWGHHEKASR